MQVESPFIVPKSLLQGRQSGRGSLELRSDLLFIIKSLLRCSLHSKLQRKVMMPILVRPLPILEMNEPRLNWHPRVWIHKGEFGYSFIDSRPQLQLKQQGQQTCSPCPCWAPCSCSSRPCCSCWQCFSLSGAGHGDNDPAAGWMTSLGAEAPSRSSWSPSWPRNAPRGRCNAPQTGPDLSKAFKFHNSIIFLYYFQKRTKGFIKWTVIAFIKPSSLYEIREFAKEFESSFKLRQVKVQN